MISYVCTTISYVTEPTISYVDIRYPGYQDSTCIPADSDADLRVPRSPATGDSDSGNINRGLTSESPESCDTARVTGLGGPALSLAALLTVIRYYQAAAATQATSANRPLIIPN